MTTTREFRLERPMQAGEAYSRGFQIYTGDAGLLIGASLVMVLCLMVIGGVLAVIQFLLQMVAGNSGGAALLIVSFGYQWLIQNPLNWIAQGVFLFPVDRMTLRLHDKEKTEFGSLFEKPAKHFRYGLAALLWNILLMVPFFLLMGMGTGIGAGIGAGGGGGGPAMGAALIIGMLCGVAAALVVVIALSPMIVLYPFIVIDNPELGLWRSLGISWRAGTKNYFPLMGVAIGSYILSGICMFFTYGLGSAVRAAAYRQIAPLAELTPEQAAAAKIAALETEQGTEGGIENDGGWDETAKK